MKPLLRATLVIATAAIAVSVGVEGVHASTQCVRYIQQKVRHHKVSAAVAARWKAWDQAHPRWHPKPAPPELTTYSCEVPVEPQQTAEALPPIQLAPLELPVELYTPPCAPPVVAANQPPPAFFPTQPSESLVTPPIYAPEYPAPYGGVAVPEAAGPPAPTPEPSAWILAATALFSSAGLAWKRRRSAATAHTIPT